MGSAFGLVVLILLIATQTSLSVSEGQTVNQNLAKKTHDGPQASALSPSQTRSPVYYRHSPSLGAPAAAVHRKTPQVPFQPEDRPFRLPFTSPSTSTTGAISAATPPAVTPQIITPAGTSIQRNIVKPGTRDGRVVRTILKQRKASHIIKKRLKNALAVPFADSTGARGDVQASSSSQSNAPSCQHPMSQSRRRLAQVATLQGSGHRAHNMEKKAVERQADKDRFMKEWRSKKLGTHLSPKALAEGIWTSKAYHESPIAAGRFAAALIRDAEGEGRYMADYTFALDRLRTTYSRMMTPFRKDATLSSTDLQAKAEQVQPLVLKYVEEVYNRRIREHRPNEIKQKMDDAHLVGGIVRASVAKDGVNLDEMTIEQIEEKTRQLKVDNMKPKRTRIALQSYLRMTRGMNKTDFNLYRRNRHLHNVEVRNLARML